METSTQLLSFPKTFYQKKYTGNNPYIDIIKDIAKANNQIELEEAIPLFDSNPKTIKWID